MAIDVKTLALAKKYTKDSMAGGGAVAGKNCVISSIDAITGGHRVTFQWTLDNGTVKTGTMDVMDGVDGQDGATGAQGPQGPKGEDGADGLGIKSVAVNAQGHLIITYDDDTTEDAGEIHVTAAVDSVNGKTGDVELTASDVGALPDDTTIPSKISDLQNDSNFVADADYVHTDNNYDDTEKAKVAAAVTKAVNDLTNYYLKTETYTKTEVDSLISAISTMHIEAVSTLPTSDIKTNIIYLVPKNPTQTSNVKDEYINLDGTTAGWEKIGDTEMDLSGYVTTTALNTALASYTTTADLTTLLAGYIQKSNTAGLVKNDGSIDETSYATAASVTAITNGTTINSFSDVETALSGKADTSDIPDITGKTDKVSGATNGNFAGLDANGNLTDSGKKAADFATQTDIAAQQILLKDTVGWTGRNLYNKATGKANTIVTQSGESTSSSYSSYNASDYIEVKANTQYYIQNGTGVQTQHTACVYDSSKAFLRYADVNGVGVQSGIINTGADAKYIRLNVRVEVIDTCMLSKGSDTNVTYEPYHKNVEDSKADKVASATNGNLASLDANGNLADSGVAATKITDAHDEDNGTSESHIDLNTYRTAGTYFWKPLKPSYTDNAPSGINESNVLLTVCPRGTSTGNTVELVQTLYHRNSQAIYVRFCYSTTNWTAWKSLSYANEGTAALLAAGTDTTQRSWTAKMLRDEFAEASEGVPSYDDLCVIPDSSLTRWVKSGRIVMVELKFEADNRSSSPIQPGRDIFTDFPVPAHEVNVILTDETDKTECTVVLTTSGWLRTITSLTAQHHYYSAQFQYISAS